MADTKHSSRVWERFIDELKDEAGILAKQELKDLIASAKQDSASFIKEQGIKLEGRLTELAEKKITAAQFEGYVKNIKDLIEMKALQQETETKARAQRIADKVADLILDKLIGLLA